MAELTQSKHYDYVPIIDREPFKLPEGKRVAVMPYINIEHFPAAIKGTPLMLFQETIQDHGMQLQEEQEHTLIQYQQHHRVRLMRL